MNLALNILAILALIWIVGGLFIMLKQTSFLGESSDIGILKIILMVLTVFIVWRIVV